MTLEPEFLEEWPIVGEAKPYSPQAKAVLEVHMKRTRAAIIASADRLSRHELILKGDIRTAIALMTPAIDSSDSRWRKVSEWLKWVGFFALGLAFPAYFVVKNAVVASKGELNLFVITGAIGLAAISLAFGLDFKGGKSRDEK